MSTRMKHWKRFSKLSRLSPLALFVLPLTVGLACGPAKGPEGPHAGNPEAIADETMKAFEAEATKPATEAMNAWIKVLEDTRELRGTPLAREASLAAIDALAGREVVGLEELGDDIGLAARVVDGERRAMEVLESTLGTDARRDPMIHVAAATAKMHFAAIRGDVAGMAAGIQASGCATEATVVGPFVGPSLGALDDVGPVDGGALAGSYPPPKNAGSPTFALGTAPTTSIGHGCSLVTTGTAVTGGLRYVVVDVEVPDAQTISVGLETQLPGKLLVAGKPAVSLAYGEIGTRMLRFGKVEVQEAGTVRLVVKLGAYAPESIAIYALSEDGLPLAAKAGTGAPPATKIGKVAPEPAAATPTSAAARTTLALGLLASGDSKRAEAVIAEVAHSKDGKTKAPPAAALVWTRTLRFAHDLPEFRRLERYRAAFDAALEGWPTSWEAIIGHAQVVALQRRGGAGEVEAISDIKKRREEAQKKGTSVDPLVDAFLSILGDEIYGVGDEAAARVKPVLAGTLVGYRLEREIDRETDDAHMKAECAPARPDVSSFECAYAKTAVGDDKGALGELSRLRALYASPKLGTSFEINATLRLSGAAAARALYDKADLGDRPLRLASELAPPGKVGIDWLRKEIRTLDGDARMLQELVTARRAAGDTSVGGDLALPFENKTKALIAKDKTSKQNAEVGTMVLDHEESYELDEGGFLHAVVWDVRHLSGTTDVDANATARVASTSGGRGYIAQTIHRIYKADGSVVEPDRIMAAQSGADLSQIQPGDYVELVAEGWFVARPDGTFDLDTPDLLPGRTAVQHATLSLTTPKNAPVELWSHAELGKPTDASAGSEKKTLVWNVANHDVRRSEKGQAFLDASVSLRLSTWSWTKLGRDAREGLLSEDERNFEVSAWVAAAAGSDRAPTVDLLARLSKAAKRTLPRIGFLPLGGGEWGMQSYTARTVLLDAQGSRVALIHRALSELGVKNDVVWAEQTPYSADPKMVARVWRFSHALLVAWVADKAGGELKPVWLDLDVDGYPPPPGRTSPELRGRLAIDTAGAIIPVPPNVDQDPDTATIEVTVDDAGHAKGTVALLLRGRDAQDVSSVLEEEAGDERDDLLREYVSAWVPGADVTDVKASAETWQVVLTAKVDYPALLIPDGKRFAIAGTPPLHAGGRAATLGRTYAALAKRKTALTIHDAVQYTLHRVIHLPSGTSVSTPLPAIDVTDASTSMKATRKASFDGTTLLEDLAFSLPTGVVAPEQFEKFTASAKAIDDGFEAVIRVLPASGPPKEEAAGEKKPTEKKPAVPKKP